MPFKLYFTHSSFCSLMKGIGGFQKDMWTFFWQHDGLIFLIIPGFSIPFHLSWGCCALWIQGDTFNVNPRMPLKNCFGLNVFELIRKKVLKRDEWMKHYKVMKHSDCSGKVMNHGDLEIKNLSDPPAWRSKARPRRVSEMTPKWVWRQIEALGHHLFQGKTAML